VTETQNETLEQACARNIRDALAEDIGRGDWTALLAGSDIWRRTFTWTTKPSATSSRSQNPTPSWYLSRPLPNFFSPTVFIETRRCV
jgi:hypothetical protein